MKRKLLVLMAIMMAAVSPTWADDNEFIYIVTSDGVRYNAYPSDKHAELISLGSFSGDDFVILDEVVHNEVPYTVTKIVDNALNFFPYRNTSIKTITIPKSIKSIGEKAFYGFTNLTTIYYNVEGSCDINSNAFGDFVSFDELVIGKKVSEYPGYIMKFINPTQITIPDHISSLGKGAFSDCSRLTSLTLPKSLLRVNNYAFAGCSNLSRLEIPDKVTNIGDYLFDGCNNLKSVYFLSNRLPNFLFHPFDGAPTSMEIYVREIVTVGSTWAGKTVNRLSNIKYTTDGNTALGITSFTNDVDFFGDFYDGDNCGYLEYKGDLTTIPSNTFKDKTNLKKIILPSTVTKIEDNAFSGCNNLNTLILLSSSKPTISSTAFSGTTALNEIYVREIASGFGSTCEGKTVNQLKNIHYTSSDNKAFKPYVISGFGENAEYLGSFYDGVKGSSKFGYFEFMGDVTKIPNQAFMENATLTGIELPNTVTEICDNAFDRTKLSSIKIPDGVTKIGKSAFNSCSSLSSLQLPESLSTLGEQSFYYCTSLTEVTIPNSVTSIGERAFSQCSTLATINVGETPASLGTDVFLGISNKGYVINVPINGYMAYKADSNWKNLNIQPAAGKLELSDSKPYTIALENNLAGCELSYTRTVTSDNWMGVYLPFDVTVTSAGSFATLTGVSDDVLDWTSQTSGTIPACTPFIFKPTEAGEISFGAEGITLHSCKENHAVTIGDYTLDGTFTTKDDMEGVYALAGGMFRRGGATAQPLSPYRIFLTVPSPSNAPIRNRVNGEDVTAIDDVDVDVDFDFDFDIDQAYNIFGQPVGDDYKGIVIVNGKKVLKK